MQQKSILGFLETLSPVMLVANNTIEGSPLITPFRDPQGNPKTDNNGSPIGSIRLEQNQRTLNGGFLNARKRVAFLGATIAVLEQIIAENKLVSGSSVPGKITITESLEPFYPNQRPKINPQTNVVVEIAVGDKKFPIFAQMRFTENLSEIDHLIRTSDDVIDWMNARRISSNINKEEEKLNADEQARIPAEGVK